MTFDEFKTALSLLRSSDNEINVLGKELFNIYDVEICDWHVASIKIGYIINNIHYGWAYYKRNFVFDNNLTEEEAYDYIFGI